MLSSAKVQIAVVKVFKALWIQDNQLINNDTSSYKQILAQTIPFGYALDPRLDSSVITDTLLTSINDSIGLSAEQVNQAFHKSWQTIIDSSHEQLALQQIAHYITTYGFEDMGIYQQDSVYIPNEVLQIPNFDTNNLSLQYIKAITTDQLIDNIYTLSSGIALADSTLDQLMIVIAELLNCKAIDSNKCISNIANRELKIRLLNRYNIVPNDPVEFLRYVIYQITGESLLIKSQQLIKAIREKRKDSKAIVTLNKLLQQSPDNLASIFLRYKPLFLALKYVSDNKTFFNRLRKQAKTQHKPLAVDFLNTVTSSIKNNQLDITTLANKLTTATIYRKVRLANALSYRINLSHLAKKDGTHSIVYSVRNGRGYATEFVWHDDLQPLAMQAYQIVLNSIADDMRANVEGKTFYIPNYVHYTVPATEKQFTGELPSGSWITVADDLIVGIHWYNVMEQTDDNIEQQKRIDLDLSLLTLNGTKLGWDSDYKSANNHAIFSGDMTDAPLPMGASELFYIRDGIKQSQALMVNYYNYQKNVSIPCKLFVAYEPLTNTVVKKNYMVNPNNIIMQTEFTMNEKQNMLGLIDNVNGYNRVYFANINLGTSISSGGRRHKLSQSRQYIRHAQQYLLNSATSVLTFKQLLTLAGARIIDTLPHSTQPIKSDSKAVEIIDLSPCNVNKTSFIELMQTK